MHIQHNRYLQPGKALLFLALLGAMAVPFFEQYRIPADLSFIEDSLHRDLIRAELLARGMIEKEYPGLMMLISDLREVLHDVQSEENAHPVSSWQYNTYLYQFARSSGHGVFRNSRPILFCGIFGAGITGSLLWIFALFGNRRSGPNLQVWNSPMTRGIPSKAHKRIWLFALIACLLYGILYMQGAPVYSIATAAVMICIAILASAKQWKSTQTGGSMPVAWLGIILGAGLIVFYIVLYWAPWWIIPWIALMDPLSQTLNGQPASQWFLYGVLYTLAIVVMGVRMLLKYRGNGYQTVRTWSVMFFQTAFAFFIPEILVRMQQPYYDFKNIWPLNYSFFFDWNLRQLLDSGTLGLFMLVWGIVLIAIAVPVLTYLFGKRWYCSWVCGCGGLAETAGDPFRHLSDKRLIAWRYERWIVHGVLVFATLMTALVLYTFFTGRSQVWFLQSDAIRSWYGFFIGAAFAGVIGVGFYPLMGNRVWCRFGCPLAAYIGLIQRFKSRFRITVNGGQCISCGNCSTYCEMGIDVRHYAQRGQDIIRASCVGCGICAAVCPRGVLKLENASRDIEMRGGQERTIHVREGDIRLLG
jgi:Pyruvate/2-oxoacid:ferredoxin oxidoreductase delta subunit